MTKEYRVLGRKSDGTLNICRATPEHRGKGNCKHSDHIEVDKTINVVEYIRQNNEKAYKKRFDSFKPVASDDKKYPKKVTANKIATSNSGFVINKQELLQGALEISQSINNQDWEFIENFHEEYISQIQEIENYENIEKDVFNFLNSDNETVVKVRKFLGDIDLYNFAVIISHQVRAMTIAEKWTLKRRISVRRAFLTALNNDMNRERYVASILFFGGRCCYCNRPLRRNPPPQYQASGEHITPVTSEDGTTSFGGTRYGNMALACFLCNRDRKNTELVEWIQTTRCIRKENKAAALGRIQAFRKFALYNEYTEDENNNIREKLDELSIIEEKFKKPEGSYYPEAEIEIPKAIKIALYDIKHGEE